MCLLNSANMSCQPCQFQMLRLCELSSATFYPSTDCYKIDISLTIKIPFFVNCLVGSPLTTCDCQALDTFLP